MLEFGLDRADELLRAAGARKVVRVQLAPFTGWHLLGTARMGADPATNVSGSCDFLPMISSRECFAQL
jgi:choline dehydrogenase-like flavoprotein